MRVGRGAWLASWFDHSVCLLYHACVVGYYQLSEGEGKMFCTNLMTTLLLVLRFKMAEYYQLNFKEIVNE